MVAQNGMTHTRKFGRPHESDIGDQECEGCAYGASGSAGFHRRGLTATHVQGYYPYRNLKYR
jgi:hypothetical protein